MSCYAEIYVWLPYSDEEERKSHRTFFVTGLLEDPALIEASLALIQFCLDRQSEAKHNKPSQAVLQHQGKAIELLQKKLSSPEAGLQRFTFWAIVVNLTLNHETGDWSSFEANLNGLRQIIELRGGPAALAAEEPRAATFAKQVEDMYLNRLNPRPYKQAGLRSINTTAECANVSMELSDDVFYQRRTSFELSGELATLHASGRLSMNTASMLSECIQYLSSCEDANIRPLILDDGKSLGSKLLATLKTSRPQSAEFVLCIGTLTLFMSERGGSSLSGAQWREGQWMLSSNLVIVLNRMWGRTYVTEHSGDSSDWIRNCLLWTSLIIATMPSRIYPNYVERHFLLEHLVSKYMRKPVVFEWERVRDVLSSLYITDSLEVRWKLRLKRAIERCN